MSCYVVICSKIVINSLVNFFFLNCIKKIKKNKKKSERAYKAEESDLPSTILSEKTKE